MKAINDDNELNKIIRQNLIAQSELDGSFVLNSLAYQGTDLDKIVDDVWQSIDGHDTLLLFELSTRESESDTEIRNDATVEDDGNYIYYKSYRIHVIIYGNSSSNVANKIVARFRSDVMRSKLYDEGVYLESISDPEKINDFKNDIMWLRSDFDINISIEMHVEPVLQDYIIRNLSDVVTNEA